MAAIVQLLQFQVSVHLGSRCRRQARAARYGSRVSDLELNVILNKHLYLGEGPLWDERTGVLRWVDILEGNLHEYDATGTSWISTGSAIGTIGLTQGRRLVAAVREGFVMLDPENGERELIVEVEADDPARRMNDGKPDPWGNFYAGTMVDDGSTPDGILWRLDPQGGLSAVETGLSCPNGLAWSGDNRTFYYIDSPTKEIWRYDVDPDSTLPTHRSVLCTLPSSIDGLPDGMTIDSEDHLWVAVFGAGCVLRLNPQGEIVRRIDFPAAQTTCPTFGGPDLRTLFVTSACENMDEPGEYDGSLFSVDVDVIGVPAHRYGSR